MAKEKEGDVVQDDNIPLTGDLLTTDTRTVIANPDTETAPLPDATPETQEPSAPETVGRWKLLSNGGAERRIGDTTPAPETRAQSEADAGEDAGELVLITGPNGGRYRVSRLAFRDLYQPYGYSIVE